MVRWCFLHISNADTANCILPAPKSDAKSNLFVKISLKNHRVPLLMCVWWGERYSFPCAWWCWWLKHSLVTTAQRERDLVFRSHLGTQCVTCFQGQLLGVFSEYSSYFHLLLPLCEITYRSKHFYPHQPTSRYSFLLSEWKDHFVATDKEFICSPTMATLKSLMKDMSSLFAHQIPTLIQS